MIEDRVISIEPEQVDTFVSERPAGIESFQPQNPITALAIPDERITRDPIIVAIDDQTQYDLIVGELHQINTSRSFTAEVPVVTDTNQQTSQPAKRGITLGDLATVGFIALGAIVEGERIYTRFTQSFWKKR